MMDTLLACFVPAIIGINGILLIFNEYMAIKKEHSEEEIKRKEKETIRQEIRHRWESIS